MLLTKQERRGLDVMYCKYCGKEIPENSKFCRFCGIKLSTEHENALLGIDDKISDKNFEKVEYAGFWVRLGAYAIDVLGAVVGSFVIGIAMAFLFEEKSTDAMPEIFWGYLSYVIYNTFTLTIWSTTFGKYMYGLRVVMESNKDLNFEVALKRSLLQPLSTLFFCVGYWNMNKNSKKQAWHDQKVHTVVVRERKNLALAYVLTLLGVITWVYLYSLGGK